MPTIQVNGVQLYYELHGSGEDVLVLNNGIIASTATWAFQLPALTPHYRVLLYDMRGQGQSQKWQPGDPDYTWEQHADDLAALLDALGIERAHIGGISYGGELTLVMPQGAGRSCIIHELGSDEVRLAVEELRRHEDRRRRSSDVLPEYSSGRAA